MLCRSGVAKLPITELEMTRFWITLEQGVNFVLKNFERMKGGEIFVPKIPSMKIVDLAKALAPNLDIEVIGIRAGEKMHEVMVPEDDGHLTLEFDDHFVIQPSIIFTKKHDYTKNNSGEIVTKMHSGFCYSSSNNNCLLDSTGLLVTIDDSL